MTYIVFSFHNSFKSEIKLSNRFHVKVYKINEEYKYNHDYNGPYNKYIRNHFKSIHYNKKSFEKVCKEVIYFYISREYDSFIITPQKNYRTTITFNEYKAAYDRYHTFIMDVLDKLNLDFIHNVYVKS